MAWTKFQHSSFSFETLEKALTWKIPVCHKKLRKEAKFIQSPRHEKCDSNKILNQKSSHNASSRTVLKNQDLSASLFAVPQASGNEPGPDSTSVRWW